MALHINGILPGAAFMAETAKPRTETGIGALMPWANRLWAVTYPSSGARSGSGMGLFTIDENLAVQKHEASVVGTYANRIIHPETNQCIIGPHIIDAAGRVRTFTDLTEHRLTATMLHLEDPAHKVYFLTMEGLLFEADVETLKTRRLFNLVQELHIPRHLQPHFKGGHTGQGRVVVANNTYGEEDLAGTAHGGRLAEWDGNTWKVLEETAFMDVAGRRNMGQVIFANGWDRISALLQVCANGTWTRYRLPKASHTFDHFWLTEWTRIREVETERYLMDCHGMFYDLMPLAYLGKVWGIRPVCSHLRVVPDFCSYRGLLVLAGNQTTPNGDNNAVAGQPQAGLWFGKTDDLWSFGKPQGWGGVWWDTPVSAGQPSDPYLMTGFEHKGLHLAHNAAVPVDFLVEVDFLGTQAWKPYTTLTVGPHGYAHHAFPAGFSAHWVRVTASSSCSATAYFHYN